MYAGAPFFAASAAVNTGSGLVYLAHPRELYPILAAKLNEVILLPQESEGGLISTRAADSLAEGLSKFDVCLAGPGLGRGRGTMRVLRSLIMQAECPLVLDADCLNALSEDVSLITRARAQVIITPHEGEFSRLLPEFSRDRREGCAVEFSKKYGCITVLKGHNTITALPSGEAFVNTTGNPGMAKGGSGDVLAGVIASLVGPGIAPEKAACIGVWLHGRAGDYEKRLQPVPGGVEH